MPLCVITDYMGDDVDLEQMLLGEAGVDVYVSRSTNPDDWLAVAEDADGILTRHAPIRVPSIKATSPMPHHLALRHRSRQHRRRCCPGTGNRISWVEGYCTEEVADDAMALMLACVRHIRSLADGLREGGWTPHPHPPIMRIRGHTLGLLGCGRIGAEVARRARAFGLRVLAYDPYSDPPAAVERVATVEELAARSDILSLHAPLTAETAGILDGARPSLLRPGAILINVARGGLLDVNAAARAMREGRLGALGLDVLDSEPPSSVHPVRTTGRGRHPAHNSTVSVDEAKRRSVAAIVRALTDTAGICQEGKSAVTNVGPSTSAV